MTSLSIILFFIFIVLGLIHFNWAMGGKWGIDQALPTKENGERVLNPKKIDSGIVGFGLTVFGFFYLFRSELMQFHLSNGIVEYGSWIIPAIFILRAVGDFKYVGFFKKVKRTKFGKLDSKLFTPLCLAIGLTGILIHTVK
jgi:Protein of unknown function (DUF3995)